MIPTIEQILEDYKNGVIDLDQALVWIDQHMFNSDLRDDFAAKAMQGILTTLSIRGEQQDPIRVSVISYDIADAMLKQRDVNC